MLIGLAFKFDNLNSNKSKTSRKNSIQVCVANLI